MLSSELYKAIIEIGIKDKVKEIFILNGFLTEIYLR